MRPSNRVNILAADDSAVMRSVLHLLFAAGEGTLHLAGVVRDGLEALAAIDALAPDLLLLDLEMPRLDGAGVLRRLRRRGSTLPVLVCSSHTERGARQTLEALSLGAGDYVMKPARGTDLAGTLAMLRQELLPRIHALAGPPPCPPSGRLSSLCPGPAPAPAQAGVELVAAAGETVPQVLVLGVSTGGPTALESLLPALPAHFPIPIVIVQHMPRVFTGAFAERLDRMCKLPVRQAWQGAAPAPGTIWIAPGDQHLQLDVQGETRRLKLEHTPPRNSCRPSVDTLFESAAASFGAHTLAVVLTGMGQDGLAGAAAVRAAGGTVLAQDQATSAVWGMPGRVVEAGLASAVVPLHALAARLCRHAGIAASLSVVHPPAASSEVHHGLL